jgi:mono/diheme cytochrome c family protein
MPAKDLISKQVNEAIDANAPATLMAVRGLARFNNVPLWLVYIVVTMVVLSWIPLAFAVKAKFTRSEKPRVHLLQGMDNQAKFKAQSLNPFFANEMAMRPRIEGTVSRGNLAEDLLYEQGFILTEAGVEWATEIPVDVTPELMAKGKELWARYCYLCHGYDGYGNGIIHVTASSDTGTNPRWVQPSSIHDEVRRDRPDGHLYNTVNIGIRNMAGYGHNIPDPTDRWAIVAYMRALQVSQHPAQTLWPEDTSGVPVQPTLVSNKALLNVLQAEEGDSGADQMPPLTDEDDPEVDTVEGDANLEEPETSPAG